MNHQAWQNNGIDFVAFDAVWLPQSKRLYEGRGEADPFGDNAALGELSGRCQSDVVLQESIE